MTRSLTSPSNLKRRQLCPGSASMETDLTDTTSAEASEGTLLHSYFMYDMMSRLALDEDQKGVVDSANAEAMNFIHLFADTLSIDPLEEINDMHEAPLSFCSNTPGVSFFGTADFIRYWPQRNMAVIVDAKFGRGEVDEASNNLQLACYAAMFQQAYPCEVIGVAIIQPRNYAKKVTSASYTAHGLEAATAEIERIVTATLAPDAPLNPSEEACQYCRAKLTCPALAERVLSVSQFAPLTAKTAPAALQLLSDDKLGQLMDTLKLARMLDTPAKHEAMKRIDLGQLPEWQMEEGNTRKTVTDTLGAYGLLVAQVPGLTEHQYMSACTLSLAALKKPVAELLGVKQVRAEILIRETLEPVIERTQNAPSVVRKSP